MAGWYTPKTRRFTFAAFGRADLYIDFKDPSSMAYRDAERIERAAETDPMASIAGLVHRWNVTDPETDEPLGKPTMEDTASVRALPADVIRAIGDFIREMAPQSEADIVPPASGTSS